jgi:hypothetical protein
MVQLARIFHELLSRDHETGNPLAASFSRVVLSGVGLMYMSLFSCWLLWTACYPYTIYFPCSLSTDLKRRIGY